MSVTADELLKALVAVGNEDFCSDPEDWSGDSDGLGWYEVDSVLQGPYNRIDDATAPYGYHYERGPAPVFAFGKVELETQVGGGEGSGEVLYLVLKVTNNDGTVQYFRKDGYYASYDGCNWDGDFREVKAIPRTVTFYE